MSEEQKIDISAVICTRNRGDRLAPTLESLLANTHPNFEVLVVDQSTNDLTEQATKPFLSDPRLRYLRSDTVGTGNSRQIGLVNARGNIVAYTDDDCMVEPTWLQEFGDIFHIDPKIAVAYCNVMPAPHDAAAGFIPGYHRHVDKLAKSVHEKRFVRGIGAGMAVRREAALSYGGFDTFLGPGSMFRDCEDGDIAMRALIKGWWVYESASISVIHDGFRTWQEGKELSRRNMTGIGAAYSKPIKCGHWEAAVIVIYEGIFMTLWKPISKILQLQKPQGVSNFYYFWRGFFKGLRRPVNRDHVLFQ